MIDKKRFYKLVKVKKLNGNYNAYITWNGLDMFQQSDNEEKAINNLFKRINTGWQDSDKSKQEND